MKSLFRFLIFVVVVGAIVAALYIWKSSTSGEPMGERPAGISKLPLLESIDHEFTSLVAEVLPSVVSINAIPADTVNPRVQFLRRLFGVEPGVTPPQVGSGVLVSKDGHIVTNYHVIAQAIEGAGAGAAPGKVEVTLSDGRVLPAKFLGADAPSDIAILKIDTENLHPMAWGNSDAVLVGQMIFAVGNPLGLQETVTQGIISAKGRRATSEAANEFFQTDAAINRGNSGGPLVNLRGELIGINNMIPLQAQGIAFSIPSNTVRQVFESIRDHGRFIRPWFGAMMQPLTPQLIQQLGLPDAVGALVLVTYAGSPAEKAGLEPGDVIIEYNGRPISDHIDLRNRVAESSLGETVKLKVRRGKQLLDLQTVIAPEPTN
jgi:serine protease Do